MAADVIFADPYGREKGFLGYAEGEFSIGIDNIFSLAIPGYSGVSEGWYLMIEGSECGGIVDGVEIDTSSPSLTVTGRTWHGMLEGNLLKPDAGQDYLTETGECNEVIGRLVQRCGLGAIMKASDSDSGFSVSSYRFSRQPAAMGCYSQIRAMLASVGAKLRIRYDGAARRAVLSAVPRADYSDDGVDGEGMPIVVSRKRTVNHLHCMGQGELKNRQVIDLYADANGNISRKQSLFGVAHIEEAYDAPSADAEDLAEDGERRLRELQEGMSECQLKEVGAEGYEIGDIVGGKSSRHGVSVTTAVAERIVKIGDGPTTCEVKTELEV